MSWQRLLLVYVDKATSDKLERYAKQGGTIEEVASLILQQAQLQDEPLAEELEVCAACRRHLYDACPDSFVDQDAGKLTAPPGCPKG